MATTVSAVMIAASREAERRTIQTLRVSNGHGLFGRTCRLPYTRKMRANVRAEMRARRAQAEASGARRTCVSIVCFIERHAAFKTSGVASPELDLSRRKVMNELQARAHDVRVLSERIGLAS